MKQKHKLKILMVDDDDGLRQIYSRFLAAEGFEVLEAHDSGRALEFANENPDVILLDVQLPESESGGLIPALRESFPQAKIVVFSCFDLHFQKKAIGNADDYFNKTEGCRALSQKIKAVLTP